MESLGFSIYNIMSTANSYSFTSSFPIWIPFTYFSCLIYLSKVSCTVLNKNGECGHPCLIPDLRGKAFSFPPLCIILVVGLSMTFIISRWWLLLSLSCVQLFVTHGLQHARLSCLSLCPRVCSNSCPLSWWCHPTISSSVTSSPLAFNLSQPQGPFQGSALRIKWPKYWSFSISPFN